MKKTIVITDIQWDTDGFEVELPTETTFEWEVSNGTFEDILQDHNIEDVIGDWLSDTYGWCHNGFKYVECDC